MFPTLLTLSRLVGRGAPSELLSIPTRLLKTGELALWPQGTSLPTSPLQCPPRLTQTYCYKKRKRKKKKILVDMTEVLPNLMENINLQTQCLPLGKWKQKDTSKTHPGQSVEKSR